MRARTLLLLLLASLLALAAAGCGGGETVAPLPQTVEGEAPDQEPADTEPEGDGEAPPGDAANGAEVFASGGCGGCHTLADAGATGTVGPNLDESELSPEEAAQVIAEGRGAMPAFSGQLDDEQIRDVAAYVTSGSAR